MIRDKRKSTEYFNRYIKTREMWVSEKEIKLEESRSDEAKAQRICLSLLKYRVDLLIANYSNGASNAELQELTDKAELIVAKLSKVDYESLLLLLSFSVVLGSSKSSFKMINSHREQINQDKLLNSFSTYLEKGTVIWTGTFTIKSLFDGLDNIDRDVDKVKALNIYLKNWYSDRSEMSWYDTDKSKYDTYNGYWSFESAAIVKLFGIDDSELRSNPFYPAF